MLAPMAMPLFGNVGFTEMLLLLFVCALIATPAILIPVLVVRARRRKRSDRSGGSDRSVG
jgi:hypothetical protein